ncbi:MAG TPA: helix-turn-helix domain-containing protein [Chitinophagaceae bacterium]|jgi:AraC-like DNA-binding protein
MKETDLNGRLYEVDPSLEEAVSHFYHVYSNKETSPIWKHLSPNLEMLLIFNFGPEVSVSFGNENPETQVIRQTAILGPLRKMLNYHLPADADSIIVNFKLNGFYRMFKMSISELSGNDILDPNRLVRNAYVHECWQEMAELKDINARLQFLNKYLISILKKDEEEVKPLLAGESYFYDPAMQPAKAIAGDAGLTERTVQLRFKKYAGYSPKELLRFLRFKAVIHQLLQPSDHPVQIFDLVVDHHYHDQSHLIKDFKHFLGTTPQQFIKKLRNNEFYIIGQDKTN